MSKIIGNIISSLAKFKKPLVLALMGFFLALAVILTRQLSFEPIPTLRIGFGFVATSMCSLLLGPVLGSINAAIADIIGFIIEPIGTFFPGFTLSAFLSGIIYGVFLYKKPLSVERVFLAVLCISVFVDLGLNTLWLSMLYNKAWVAILGTRLLARAIMLPIQTLVIYFLAKYISPYFNNNLARKIDS